MEGLRAILADPKNIRNWKSLVFFGLDHFYTGIDPLSRAPDHGLLGKYITGTKVGIGFVILIPPPPSLLHHFQAKLWRAIESSMTTGSNRGWVPSRRSRSLGPNDEVSTYAVAARSKPELAESSPNATSPPEVGRAPEHRGEAGADGAWPRMGGEIPRATRWPGGCNDAEAGAPAFHHQRRLCRSWKTAAQSRAKLNGPAMTIVISWRP
jgi:hypothetical protein